MFLFLLNSTPKHDYPPLTCMASPQRQSEQIWYFTLLERTGLTPGNVAAPTSLIHFRELNLRRLEWSHRQLSWCSLWWLHPWNIQQQTTY